MKSFGELLSEYINRIGVTDAELARRLGVSRQTIFRWRQGHTRRPRYREDVLEMARKLRLTPQERDALLVAAGFHPEGETIGPLVAGEGEGQRVGVPRGRLEWRRLMPAGWALLLILLLAAAAWLVDGGAPRLLAGLGAGEEMPAAAEAGETLLLVSEFANYGGERMGFNVAGRLVEALQETFGQAELGAVRIERYPRVVQSASQAQQALDALGATMLLWGEYDSGRVIVRTSAAGLDPSARRLERRWLVASPEELSATINFSLSEEVRWMALYVLGRVYVQRGQWDAARQAFTRAHLLGVTDDNAQASLSFYLGLAESQRAQPDWDQVIAYYTAALLDQPGHLSARQNRGLAYLRRGAQGDLARAEADLRAVLELDPTHTPAALNLAVVLAHDSPPRLEEALQLLAEAAETASDRAELENALCWYGSLAGDPAGALPHCDAAVELDASGYSNDSRGLALALLGRYDEAAQEFARFLEKLQAEDPAQWERYAPSRQGWIAALQEGRNPFAEAELQRLLQE